MISQSQKKGLYLVSTPIGNLGDLTIRALEILKNSELILCEDTRVSIKLLNHFDIKTQLIALHKFNERLIFENSEFIVQDVLFNTLLLQSNKALIELAKILDYKNDINLLKYWVNKNENAIETKLYNNGFFYD